MRNIFFCFLLASLASCTHLESVAPVDTGAVQVEIPVRNEDMEPQTRATDENSIRDVNYYLIGSEYKEVIHGYERSADLRFECPPGTYDLYVVANIHSDLGVKTAQELRDMTLDYDYQYDDLPMWAKQTISIPSRNNGNLYRLPAITVKRGLAKVAVNVRSEVSDIILKSVRMVCIPRVSRPFAENPSPSTIRSDYTQGPITYFPAYEESYSEVYYLPENLQGERPDITDETQKGPENAPKYATYLLIRAEKEGVALAYRIYLGSNNTTNFDVRRNTCYSYNVNIRGENEVDTRVSSYYVSIMIGFSNDGCGTYYIPGSAHNMRLKIIGENTARLRGRLELLKGSPTDFSFNTAGGLSEYTFTIRNNNGLNEYPINYAPPLIRRDNSLLEFRIVIEDEGGIETGYRFQYQFRNIVEIYRSANRGKITASGATYTGTKLDGTQTVLCYENCTLQAIPDGGALFEGWYADGGFQNLLSADASYTYVPTQCQGRIYAKFGTGTALDDKGTANCYIASRRRTYYSFDATVQGNNAATTNVTPRPLDGVQAKVIWETGNRAGDIVSDVSYGGGRILFRTGTYTGNALIGLFDKDGTCIWSWHIWVTGYDPEKTQQTYGGGSVFMDRNLGALSIDHKQVSTRGLYYQWGRKDPLPYPSDITSHEPLIGSYQNGFTNTTLARKMTVSYTIEHPTTYLDTDTDWLLSVAANPNLWGNTSSETTLTDTGSKSIYDPCPPGWRVPDRRTWAKAALKIKASNATYYFLCYSGSETEILYPMSGYFSGSDYPNVASWGYTWTNAPTADGAAALVLHGGAVYPTENLMRSYALPVRCMRE